MMTLFAKDGTPKLVERCTYPLTGLACASKVYTEYGLFLVGTGGVRVVETFGIGVAELKERMDVEVRRLEDQ